MTNTPTLTGKQMRKLLEDNGWYLDKIKGSHHHFLHDIIKERIIVPIHGNKDLKRGIQDDIMKKAGLKL